MTTARKPITSQYAGHCANRSCVTAFAAGTTVYWARGAGAICGLCYEGAAPAPASDLEPLTELGDDALIEEFKALARLARPELQPGLDRALDAVHEAFMARHPELQAKTATDLLTGMAITAVAQGQQGETEADAARRGFLWLGVVDRGYQRGYVTSYGRTTRDGVKVPALVLAGLGRFAQDSHVYALTDLVERDRPYAQEAYAAYVQAIKDGAEKSAAIKAASLAVLEMQEAEAIDREVERQAEGR